MSNLGNDIGLNIGEYIDNGFANWAERNGWTYNFSDGKWWQLQESHGKLGLLY